jgi:hypothetical protein
MGTKEQELATSWWGNPLGRASIQKGQEKRLEREPEIVPAEEGELPPVIGKHRITVEGITEEEAEDLAAYFRRRDSKVTVQSGEGRAGSPLRMGVQRRSTSSGSRHVSNASSGIEFLDPDDTTVVLPIKVAVATVPSGRWHQLRPVGEGCAGCRSAKGRALLSGVNHTHARDKG